MSHLSVEIALNSSNIVLLLFVMKVSLAVELPVLPPSCIGNSDNNISTTTTALDLKRFGFITKILNGLSNSIEYPKLVLVISLSGLEVDIVVGMSGHHSVEHKLIHNVEGFVDLETELLVEAPGLSLWCFVDVDNSPVLLSLLAVESVGQNVLSFAVLSTLDLNHSLIVDVLEVLANVFEQLVPLTVGVSTVDVQLVASSVKRVGWCSL